jgi:hypothetical protein
LNVTPLQGFPGMGGWLRRLDSHRISLYCYGMMLVYHDGRSGQAAGISLQKSRVRNCAPLGYSAIPTGGQAES